MLSERPCVLQGCEHTTLHTEAEISGRRDRIQESGMSSTSRAEILIFVGAKTPAIRCSDKPVAGSRVDEAWSQLLSPELPRSPTARQSLQLGNPQRPRHSQELQGFSNWEFFGVSDGNRAVAMGIVRTDAICVREDAAQQSKAVPRKHRYKFRSRCWPSVPKLPRAI